MALEQSADVREVFLRYYQAIQTADVGLLATLLSHEEGVLGIGTDPAEWWSGYATLERIITAQMREMRDAGVTFQPGDAQCYSEGSVGWCADQGRIRLPDGPEVPARITAVFHQEGGDWKMVQFHTSIGVPNAEAIGTDLTT